MSKLETLGRRTFLRGAGTIAIGLPLLEEMRPRLARGREAEPNQRMLTCFFGLGIEQSFQQDLTGPLEPYKDIAHKMAFFNNVNHNYPTRSNGAHCVNAPLVFVGESAKSNNVSGGPSVDQLMKKLLHPSGPPTKLSTLNTGAWFRKGACDSQPQRIWNADGSMGPRAERVPSVIFEQLFGGGAPVPVDPMTQMSDPAVLAEVHFRRSVLDTVKSQYDWLSGDRSPLGSASKQKVSLYLDSLREVERNVPTVEQALKGLPIGGGMACSTPAAVTDPEFGTDYRGDIGYGANEDAPEIDVPVFTAWVDMLADLWFLALQCDAVRFGGMLIAAAGCHIGLKGSYSAIGGSFNFGGDSVHHSYFHSYTPEAVRQYQHLTNARFARLLMQMDSAQEPNGKSILDNSCVLISTEYGRNHDSDFVFHAIAGGGGRFNSGFYSDDIIAADVYNAAFSGYGLDAGIGKGLPTKGTIPGLLA